jgi:hypothetical protein
MRKFKQLRLELVKNLDGLEEVHMSKMREIWITQVLWEVRRKLAEPVHNLMYASENAFKT